MMLAWILKLSLLFIVLCLVLFGDNPPNGTSGKRLAIFVQVNER